MIVTLSPAKMINFAEEDIEAGQTKPRFDKQAKELNSLLQNLNMEDVKTLMKINPAQAMEVYQYIHGFGSGKAPEKQAAFAYNGIAYSGLNVRGFSSSELDYLQDHLVVLSGLYGALRPLDMIKPYRLEMQIKLENDKAKDLYAYWKPTLTNYLSERLLADDKIWVNLMSTEYTKAIDKKKLPEGTQIITPDFKEQTDKGYRQVVVYTKKARGMLARFILKHRLTSADDLMAFDEEGYYYSQELSTPNNPVFVR
ncbi:YaaA family protein [Dysgonomonas sp. 520]|uniref:YaaA family protein n=1 Tax=Dysgonomonas sp. 520 TaxID=2302931 RepID=UPI0013D1D950|nr:YaaA family protein [Dysgonomonas sp. 520]NDW09942.1 YaaA family protein [Dysgonomonas sp. 520]